MKKYMIGLIGITILLSGCTNSNVMECTSTSEEAGYKVESKSVATFDGDNVTTIRHYAIFTYDKNNLEMLDLTYSMLDSMFQEYNDYSGIEYLSEKGESTASFEIKIDVKKASNDVLEASENGVIDIKSIPATRDAFKTDATAKGMTCK